MNHWEDHISKHKRCSHLYEGDPDDEDEGEEVMAAMCHNTEVYNSIKVNRKDDKPVKGGVAPGLVL